MSRALKSAFLTAFEVAEEAHNEAPMIIAGVVFLALNMERPELLERLLPITYEIRAELVKKTDGEDWPDMLRDL